MIDRYLLRYLLAVVDHGSFTRGAIHCGVSQPTLSAGISKLELEVGTALLLRTNRRVELTGTGVRWVERARRIEREFTLAEQEVRTGHVDETLRLGVLSSLPSRWMESALQAALGKRGSARVELIEANEKTLLSQLDRGRLDVLLTVVRSARSRFAEVIFEEGYGLVMPVGHPLSGRSSVDAEEVADSPMIVRRHCEALADTSRHFTSRGVRPFMSARANSDDQALAYVRAGQGLTVMPDCFADHAIAMTRLSGFDISRTIGLVYDRIPAERVQSGVLEMIKDCIGASHRNLARSAR